MASTLVAQVPGARIPPRLDDHFQRRLVVNRIDLTEKLNEPIVATENPALYNANAHGETQGMIMSLLNGIKSGKYLAYDPDSLNKSLTYEDVVELAQQIGGTMEDPDEIPDWEMEEEWEIDEEWEVDEEDGSSGGEGDWDVIDGASAASGTEDIDVAAFETVVEFIENRIFDKNRSDMVYDIQYIRLVWVDPGETLPDKNFICLRYADVLETLEDTQWKNRHNDAECRNLREVFEQRMFNSFAINISGRGARTLEESDLRSTQMLEFEHNLWSY
ncbi:MAG: hypothetical protein AAF570_16775 [Bacteroidota bacterium]